MDHSQRHKTFAQLILGLMLIVLANSKKGLPSVSELKFLQKYGYLDPPAANSEALYKHEAVIEAIKSMQRYGNVPVTGAMDNATKALLTSPRCGVPDVIKHNRHQYTNSSRIRRFVIASEGWRKRHLTYFLYNWTPKLGSRNTVLLELERAFKSWSDYSQLTFQHTDDVNADIVISFAAQDHADGYPFDGPGGTLAHAYFPYDFDAFGGDVHFDNDEDWIAGPGSGVDFFTVAVHELGHSLGLGHSYDPESIMFPYYRGFNPYFNLGYDDILAMYQLYVVAKFEDDTLTVEKTTKIARKTTTTTPTYETDKEVDDEGVARDDDDKHPTTKHNDGKKWTSKPSSSTTPTPPQPTSKPDPIPDLCEGSYDSLAMIRGELFVFKGQYMWRFRDRKRLENGYPMKFKEMFHFPKPVTRIDTAYEDQQGYTHFFSGRQIFIHDGSQFIDKWPKSLSDLNIKASVSKLDASFVWSKNDKTYMFSGNEFWRYDSSTLNLDKSYPKQMSRWRGVPYPIDSALRWIDGNTYFFVGNHFYRFNDRRVYVEEGPLSVADHWFNCTTYSTSVAIKHRTKKHNRRSRKKKSSRRHSS